MTQLEVKSNESGQYLEYKGVKLLYLHTVKEQYGEYDFFDMNPAALKGYTQKVDMFQIGEFNEKIVSDHDNIGCGFTFFAEDIDENSFKIIIKFHYQRTGSWDYEIGRFKYHSL